MCRLPTSGRTQTRASTKQTDASTEIPRRRSELKASWSGFPCKTKTCASVAWVTADQWLRQIFPYQCLTNQAWQLISFLILFFISFFLHCNWNRDDDYLGQFYLNSWQLSILYVLIWQSMAPSPWLIKVQQYCTYSVLVFCKSPDLEDPWVCICHLEILQSLTQRGSAWCLWHVSNRSGLSLSPMLSSAAEEVHFGSVTGRSVCLLCPGTVSCVECWEFGNALIFHPQDRVLDCVAIAQQSASRHNLFVLLPGRGNT